MFDMTSMLLGAAASGIGLCLTMLVLWSADRSSTFKVNWSVGISFLIFHVLAYWAYARYQILSAGVLACALQPVGAAFVYASVRQFFDERFKTLKLVVVVSVPYLLVVPGIFAMGYDGVALIIQNAVTANLLILGGLCYLSRWREEAPLAISGLSILYMLAGFSFALCGMVLLGARQWTIGHAPDNWAEELNIVISIGALTGAGALTLSVDLARAAQRNRMTALSDPLSGLLNRRGLEATVPARLYEKDAVVIFDLDNFKIVNDRHGHAAGDRAICIFADTLREYGRSGDSKARLGGEEFAMVLIGVTPKEARRIAERILSKFSLIDIRSDLGKNFRCTASAGLAFGNKAGLSVEDVTARADHALYSAKDSGRNRVESGKLRLVS